MRKIAAVAALICLVVLAGCVSVPRATDNGKMRSIWSGVSDKDYVRTRGVGAVSPQARGQTYRRGLSRNSALVSARYEMLVIIKGIRVTGGLTVGSLMETNSKIAEIANRIVHGAEEIKTEWAADDGCVVTLEIRRDRVEKLIEEDKKFEPVTERENWEAEQRRLERAAKLEASLASHRTSINIPTYYRTYSNDKDPAMALLLGLAVPGLGQLYAGDLSFHNTGWWYMTGVVSLAAIGNYYYQPHDIGPMMSDGKYAQQRDPTVGVFFFSLAGALHLYAALDSVGAARENGHYVLVPVKNGGMVVFAKRF